MASLFALDNKPYFSYHKCKIIAIYSKSRIKSARKLAAVELYNKTEPPWTMIYTLVENVRSLYNVGAIFRTADGVGVSKIFLTGITGRPPHREIRKVALGAEEAIEWEYCPESVAVVEKLRKENVQIVVLEATGESICYDKAHYRFPLCLVVGHEYNGVSDAVLKRADLVVGIPMQGRKISLNVAVAFGVAVYEISRLRGTLHE